VVASGDLLWHSGKRLEESAELSWSCSLEKSAITERRRAILPWKINLINPTRGALGPRHGFNTRMLHAPLAPRKM